MKIIRPLRISDDNVISNNVLENDYDRWLSTTTYNIDDKVIVGNQAEDCTLTIASPCVVTSKLKDLSVDDVVLLRTSGVLPTGLTAKVPYYLKTVELLGVAGTITVDTAPRGVVYCPTNDRLYITNSGSNNVSVVRPSDNTVMTTITVGTTPWGITYCPTNDRVYVINVTPAPNNISVIRPSDNIVVSSHSLGTNAYNAVYCPTNDRVYITNYSNNNVSVIRPSDNTVVATITVGTTPYGITYCPTTDGVYVTNTISNNISVIRPSDNTVRATITVGTTPYGITYCPTVDMLYIANSTTNNVSALFPQPTFTLSATSGGAAINTSGTQSGTHSVQLLEPQVSSRVSISKTSPAVITWPEHGLVDGNEVTLYTTNVLPTGFSVGLTYYVVNSNSSTFQLASTLNGAGISTSADTIGEVFCVSKRHNIYESLVNTNLNYPPHKNPTKWLDLGYDNKWKMFDLSNVSQTRNPELIDLNIKAAGYTDSLALLNISAASVTITGTDSVSGIVYGPTTYQLYDNSSVGDWWTYFFEPIIHKTDWVDTDFPPYSNLLFHITINHPAAIAEIGTVVLGLSKNLGSTQYGSNVGIMDYSVKQRDEFGNYTVVERAFSKRARFTLMVNSSLVDSVVRVLSEYRAIPAVYVGSDSYTSTISYGFYKDFNVDISYPTISACSIDVEGLT